MASAYTGPPRDRIPAASACRIPRPLQALLAAVLIAAVYVSLRIYSLSLPLDRDEGAFGYIGWRILQGETPYRDAVDHKPPGVFYLYALALLVFPPTPEGIHLFLHLYNLLTLGGVLLLLWLRFRDRATVFWGGVCYAAFSASPAVQGLTASSEMLALLPVVLGIVLALAARGRMGVPAALLSGICGAGAFWIKQTAATAALLAPLWLALAPAGEEGPPGGPRDRRRGRPALTAAWLAGALLFSGLVAGHFATRGLWDEFFYWSFTHNFAYAGQGGAVNLTGVGAGLAEIVRGNFAALAAGAAFAALGFGSRRRESIFLWGFLGLSLAGTLPGYAYAHYFAQLVPALAVLSGRGIAGWLRKIPGGALPGTVALALVTILPAAAYREILLEPSPVRASRHQFGLNPFVESQAVGRFLAGRTAPGERILIFGSEPQILLYARRASATRFVMTYPLLRDYPRYREFQRQAWEEIRRSRPRYVLLVNIPTSTLWDGRAELTLLQQIDGMIQRDYLLEAVMTVRDPQGELLQVPEGQAAPPALPPGAFPVFIYRARF